MMSGVPEGVTDTGPSCLSVRSGHSEVDISSSSQSPESEECKPAFRDPERVTVRNGDIRDHAKTGSGQNTGDSGPRH